MRSTLFLTAAALALPFACLAQEWEVGGTGGYGWYSNPSIVSPTGSIQSGMIPKGLIGVVFGQNMYEHIGGEVRYLFQFGGPQLRQDGVQVNATGYTNTIVYDLLVHLTDREARFRPYIGGGAGIKVYTGTEFGFIGQPFDGAAVLKRHTQVEPAISVGAGVKYKVARHALIRFDFRTYMTPFPNEVLRPVGYNSKVHGWIYNFVPMGGVSVIF